MNQWHEQEHPWSSGLTPAVRAILLFTCIVFVGQMLMPREFDFLFGLSLNGLRHGFLWQLVTYMFLHAGILHLGLNMLWLYFMGPEVERSIGGQHFMFLYFVSGILGGLGWILISSGGSPCIGASGAVFGVMGAFAALFPMRRITLLVFFVLPVTMNAWVMVLILGLIQLAYLLTSVGGGVAYAAHIAGAISGYIYAATLFRGWGWTRGLFHFSAKRPKLTILPGVGAGSATNDSDVDRILDKISAQGMGSLTRPERETLERASRQPPV